MQERNRETLQRAIEQLRTYAPGEDLWARIDEQIDRSPQLPGLEKLPSYAPPPQVWNTLSRTLDKEQGWQLRRRRYIRLGAVAAGLLLLFSLLIPLGKPTAKISIAVHEEPADGIMVSADWHEEDERFDALLNHLATDNEPAVNVLKVELEELTGARREVEEMLYRYGQDPQLIRQLGEIERERSDIYRQLIAHM